MYEFLKSMRADGCSYVIDKVKINDEILEVDCSIDEHKYIICKLENIKKYIYKDSLTNDIGFWMRTDKNKFPEYITDFFVTMKGNGEYEIKCWMLFSYDRWNWIWTIDFYLSVFNKELEETLRYKYDKFNLQIDYDYDDTDGYYALSIVCTTENINLIYEEINEYINIIKMTYENTIHKLNDYNELNKYNIYKVPLDSRIMISVKQYLNFFPEYVRRAKGMKVKFEVTSDDEFLNLHIDKEVDYEIVSKYLMEYVNFIKESLENINPEIISNLDEKDKEILIVDLRNQIRYLESSMEIKNIEIRLKEREIHRLEGFVNGFIGGVSNKISLNIVSNNNTSISNININIQDELEKLQDEIFDIKEILVDANDAIREEINDVDKQLMTLEGDNIENIQGNKQIFRKIRRLINKCNDPNSDINKIITKSEKAALKLQKVARIYNKFAQWLSMPQIPDIFLAE